MGIVDKAKPLEDIEPYIKMVLYGDTGVGKTTWAASSPKPIWFDFERSSESLRHNDVTKSVPVLRGGIELKSFADVKQAVREIKTQKNYETLVFDTTSSMYIMYMHQYMAKVEETSKDHRSRYLPYQGDYRYANNELGEFWLDLQQMEANIIFIAHDKRVENENGTVVEIRPLLAPGVWDQMKQFVNVVAYYERKVSVGKTERFMYLNSTNIINAKNRLGIQDTKIQDPKFKEIFK